MKLIYSILEKVGAWWLIGICSIITLFCLRYLCNPTPLVTNLYYTIDEVIRLSMCVVGYNEKSLAKWRPLIIFASTVTCIRLMNEIFYLSGLLDVNNTYLLFIELPLTLIILWRTSKHYHSL